MFTTILVGYDGSAGSRAALTAACHLAQLRHRATVVAVTVQHPLPRYPATCSEVDAEWEADAAAARRLGNEVAALADEMAARMTHAVVRGRPAHELVRTAQDNRADLIVVGHRDHLALWGTLLSSTSDRVSRRAPCSVLIV